MAGKVAALTPRREQTAGSMRRLAGKAETLHPKMHVHVHVRDAARELERGNHAGAIRHLNAAIHTLTPQSLFRHGMLTDDDQTQAKQTMDKIHRHVLQVKDLDDAVARNQAALAQSRMAPPMPPPGLPLRAELGTDRQPSSGRALNAPNSTPVGKPDGAASGPAAPVTTFKGHPSQLANGVWGIELTGDGHGHHIPGSPMVYKHGWLPIAGGGSLAAFAKSAPARWAAQDRASGLWGKLTPAQHEAEVSKLNPAQRAAYDRETAAGRKPYAALAYAKGATPEFEQARQHAAAIQRSRNAFARPPLDEVRSSVGKPGAPRIKSGFGAGTEPGSFEHISAIQDLAQRAANSSGDPGHASPMMATALDNVARAVAKRDMDAARIHLASAKWANRHEAGGLYNNELSALSTQLTQVPTSVTGFRNRVPPNPLSPRGQNPGRYVSHAAQPPADVTAGALKQFNPATGSMQFSAQTGALATVPHPFGRPGGPGLWGVKGMELPPYIQNIAHALLRTGRAKTLGQAIAMAKAATARWAAGKNTKPEVRAASAATDADWEAKRARAASSHSNEPEHFRWTVIELAVESICR